MTASHRLVAFAASVTVLGSWLTILLLLWATKLPLPAIPRFPRSELQFDVTDRPGASSKF